MSMDRRGFLRGAVAGLCAAAAPVPVLSVTEPDGLSIECVSDMLKMLYPESAVGPLLRAQHPFFAALRKKADQ